jgi:signal transduction histidine kinase
MVAAPIMVLRQATAHISAGVLDSPIEMRGSDEIEALARDFNRMTERLSASYAELEGRLRNAPRSCRMRATRCRSSPPELETLSARLVRQVDDLALRKEEAERASVAKTRFLATASHDLRQPMHSIACWWACCETAFRTRTSSRWPTRPRPRWPQRSTTAASWK